VQSKINARKALRAISSVAAAAHLANGFEHRQRTADFQGFFGFLKGKGDLFRFHQSKKTLKGRR
jgi:hypothetical protein